MFSAIFSIFLAVGFISVVTVLDEEQRSAYEAAFKCTKAGWYGDGHSLGAEGKEAINAEMLEACCTFSRVSKNGHCHRYFIMTFTHEATRYDCVAQQLLYNKCFV